MMLQINHLYKSYRSGEARIHVLIDLSLQVREGDMVAVTGESGSGKSTFLHLVGGMEKPDAGQIVFDGSDITELQGHELADLRNRRIGFIFQFHHLLPEFSALENVMFPLLLRRETFRKCAERATELLVEVGLGERLDHKPGELSGGEQQRVAVARALAGSPQLLLADEPTGNLDEGTAQTVYQLLLEIHDRHGLTSIIVTHNARLASLCHYQKLMSAGRLV